LLASKFGTNITKTPATHFILLYQETFRQFDEFSTIAEHFPDSAIMLMLQNAANRMEEYRKVKTTTDTNAKVTGTPITHRQYIIFLNLLLHIMTGLIHLLRQGILLHMSLFLQGDRISMKTKSLIFMREI
jgi:hypothetical protein